MAVHCGHHCYVSKRGENKHKKSNTFNKSIITENKHKTIKCNKSIITITNPEEEKKKPQQKLKKSTNQQNQNTTKTKQTSDRTKKSKLVGRNNKALSLTLSLDLGFKSKLVGRNNKANKRF